ncbi:MAG: ABC transporter permease [Phycisphaerales bacterium]|nr:ABC transporter permease [Phycisphaerales bacterium]
MRVFGAMLVDAYRELNSKKLFWVILAISGVVVLGYGSIGFDAAGVSIGFGIWHVESEFLYDGSVLSTIFYRSIFASFIVAIWLTWIATILALISTTTVFPDFIAGGAIDLVLAKPIGRLRLFVYKYLVSLLFVVLQVTLFCIGIFLCMGLRVGDWDPLVFAAIPLVIVFFSYLFSVSVLVGVWTRSAITALLLTILFWFGLYSMNQTEAILLTVKTQFQLETEHAAERLAALEANAGDEPDETTTSRIAELRTEQQEAEDLVARLDTWYRLTAGIKAVLPKTGETIGLLDRWLSRDSDINIMDIFTGNVQADGNGQFSLGGRPDRDREAQRRVQAVYAGRSETYVIGTSLAFEFVMLGLAAWIFCRRDY